MTAHGDSEADEARNKQMQTCNSHKITRLYPDSSGGGGGGGDEV